MKRTETSRPSLGERPHQAGRPTSEELERRKKKVMEVATKLFLRQGFAATSLVDITKAAGVATRTLYQHFGDKEAIFVEVVTARETGAMFACPPISGDKTLFEALMQIARFICDVALRDRSVDLTRLMIGESRRFPKFMTKLSRKTLKDFRGSVAAMFDELIQHGTTPEIDSRVSAILFVDLILGSAPLLVYAGWMSSHPTDAELERKIDLFILGRFGPSVAERARGPIPAPN